MSHVYQPLNLVRAINKDAVKVLVDSIQELGLKTPITVRPARRLRDGVESDVWEIVSGNHRYEACDRLKFMEIDAFVTDMDDRQCRLWSIAENLHRAELSTLEKSKLINEWRELTDQQVRQLDAPVPGGMQPGESGIRKVARDLGLSEVEVRRSKRISSLSPEAQQAAIETGLDDNQSALIEAAKQKTPQQQVEYLHQRKSMKLAEPPKDDFEAREAWLSSMMRLWNKASQDWRQEFLKRAG